MTTRMAGISGTLDTTAMVTATLEPYKLKVTNKEKEMKLYELKQTQYRDVITKTTDFYNKYLTTSNSDSLMNSSNFKTVAFSSSDEGAVTAQALAGSSVQNYTVKVNQLATAATKGFKEGDLTSGNTVTINGQNFTLEGKDSKEIAKNLNSKILEYNSKVTDSSKKIDVTVKYSDFAVEDASHNASSGIVIKSNTLGGASKFSMTYSGTTYNVEGQKADVEITNNNGMIKKYTGDTNNVTYDNVLFTFNSKTLDSNGAATTAKIIGKTDITAIKDKIVSFVKDYNTMITNLNTKLIEKRDKNYMPLTSDEKSEMNESDVKLWDEKVNTGLIRRDDDVQKIVNQLKSSMTTMMSATGLKLESIGIKPVDNFKTTNGTFTIDDAKLTDALKNNMEGVKELFTKDSTGNNLTSGVLTNLQSVLQKEVILGTGALVKKAGLPGSISDDMSQQLTKMQTELTEMNTGLTERENLLYTKYARLESALSKLNSQQDWISQQFA